MRKLNAKPILKWAGGKTQLLDVLNAEIKRIDNKRTLTYIEPFLGGGSVFIDIAKQDLFNKYIINDINSKLINVYIQVRDNPEDLICSLEKTKKEYLSLDENSRKEYYYKKRDKFNSYLKKKELDNSDKISYASLFIFMNKTCFNGLYRENSKGEFNVPAGKYKNPAIYNSEDIFNLSNLLNMCDKNGNRRVEILNKNYLEIENFIENESFIYFDPPYRPITEGGFNTYHKSSFNDESQKELANLYRRLNKRNIYLMLSNSDPKNLDKNDKFFDDLYNGFHIKRIKAKRMINSNGNGRGSITELLITNY